MLHCPFGWHFSIYIHCLAARYRNKKMNKKKNEPTMQHRKRKKCLQKNHQRWIYFFIFIVFQSTHTFNAVTHTGTQNIAFIMKIAFSINCSADADRCAKLPIQPCKYISSWSFQFAFFQNIFKSFANRSFKYVYPVFGFACFSFVLSKLIYQPATMNAF